MKKITSIILLFLVLFSGIRISIAFHYCGGKEVASKVSLSGQPASCGMETTQKKHDSSSLLKPHCCDDLVTTISLKANYLPVYFSVPTDKGSAADHNFSLPYNSFAANCNYHITTGSDTGPPGIFWPAHVDLDKICSLRI